MEWPLDDDPLGPRPPDNLVDGLGAAIAGALQVAVADLSKQAGGWSPSALGWIFSGQIRGQTFQDILGTTAQDVRLGRSLRNFLQRRRSPSRSGIAAAGGRR